MTRSPASALRTAVASRSGGESLTMNADTPDSIARRRKPGRPNVVRITIFTPGWRTVQLARGREAVHPGHLDVQQGHVDVVLGGGPDHLVAPADLGDDLHVGLEGQQRGERLADQGLVVGEEKPDGAGAVGAGLASRWSRGTLASTGRLPAAGGAWRRRLGLGGGGNGGDQAETAAVSPGGATENRPPTADSRSDMPCRPVPAGREPDGGAEPAAVVADLERDLARTFRQPGSGSWPRRSGGSRWWPPRAGTRPAPPRASGSKRARPHGQGRVVVEVMPAASSEVRAVMISTASVGRR